LLQWFVRLRREGEIATRPGQDGFPRLNAF